MLVKMAGLISEIDDPVLEENLPPGSNQTRISPTYRRFSTISSQIIENR